MTHCDNMLHASSAAAYTSERILWLQKYIMAQKGCLKAANEAYWLTGMMMVTL